MLVEGRGAVQSMRTARRGEDVIPGKDPSQRELVYEVGCVSFY